MRTVAAAILVVALAASAEAYEHWNDIRHSALLPDDDVTVRVESPSGAGVQNYLLFGGNGIEETAMTSVLDGPSTVAATVPGPVSATRYYGFRLIENGVLDLMPIRIADATSPVPADLTRLAADAVGDGLPGYANLDLTDCHVGFSGTRLYCALTNAGGGFPVSSGLTFFGYVLGVADPARTDPDTVFVLMHTFNQPGIITPGLYKATGTGLSDLERLGDVTVQTYGATNQLMISCQLSDLMGDPYFASWYDPADPEIGVAAFTQKITLLGGVTQADESPGGTCSLRELAIAPVANQLPALSNLSFVGAGQGAYARVDYDDVNGHCPVIAGISFDGGALYPMYPQTLDYGTTVTYATDAGIAPLAGGGWLLAVARFSDNLVDEVELEASSTGVAGGGEARGPLVSSIAPNPFSATTHIEYSMPAGGHLRVEVFDAAGRLVRTLLDGVVSAGRSDLAWDGRDDHGLRAGSGTYFCRLVGAEGSGLTKMTLVR
jgi:hypothetical protein